MKLIIVAFSLSLCYAFTPANFTLVNSKVVVEIESLNPDLFKEYMLNSLEDSKIEILEACVPAKVIYVNYSGLLDESGRQELLNFFEQPSVSSSVKLLLEDTLEDFTEKCQAARLGN